MSEEYDDENHWHTHANLLFGFICYQPGCDQAFGYDEYPIADLDEQFLIFCVEISKEAQKRGWTCKGDWEFYCPECSLNYHSLSSRFKRTHHKIMLAFRRSLSLLFQ